MSRTMVPRMVAQDCARTALDHSHNLGKSWATQDSIHWLKVCAAASIHWGNEDMASWCVMYHLGNSSTCSGARYKAA